MKKHIRKGYDIPILGKAEPVFGKADAPSYCSVRPNAFHYVKPKLSVSVGDTVKIGTQLFFDKRQPDISFVSPASGKISDIRFGQHRIVECITIEASSEDAEQWPSFRSDEIRSQGRDELIEVFLKGGMWPFIRQRPFDIIADPNRKPAAIFVNCMDTAPLATDPEFALKSLEADFRAGIEALRVLCRQVHIVSDARVPSSIFHKGMENQKGVFLHSFSGPHPAGLVGTHIYHIYPLSSSQIVWFLNARDVVQLGSFLLVGQYPTKQIISMAGAGVKKPTYVKLMAGANLKSLLENNLVDGDMRIISGNLLTGKEINLNDSVGFYDDLITVIPERQERHFIGWMLPGFARPSWSRAFASSLFPWKHCQINANKNGELRALVKTGDYEKVVTLGILPSYLVKAILTEDIELMEQLGIYEAAPEDVALCSYICPSKVEFMEIIRSGLDMMLSETA